MRSGIWPPYADMCMYACFYKPRARFEACANLQTKSVVSESELTVNKCTENMQQSVKCA